MGHDCRHNIKCDSTNIKQAFLRGLCITLVAPSVMPKRFRNNGRGYIQVCSIIISTFQSMKIVRNANLTDMCMIGNQIQVAVNIAYKL